MHYRIILIYLFLLIPAISCTLRPENSKEKTRYYTVTRIVDGDTFWLDDGSVSGLKVRLIGIDAPEAHDSEFKSKAYYGDEAKEYLKKLIGGRKVRLEYDIELYDQYDRTLAYAYLENGTFVNAEMVRNGYAMVMTIPPNVRHAGTFIDLARKARKQKKGLWAAPLKKQGEWGCIKVI